MSEEQGAWRKRVAWVLWVALVSGCFGSWVGLQQCQMRLDAAQNAARQQERARADREAEADRAFAEGQRERADREALRWLGRTYLPAYTRAQAACWALQACFDGPMRSVTSCAARTERACEDALGEIRVTSAPEVVRLAVASDVDDLRFISVCALRAGLAVASEDARSWNDIRTAMEDSVLEQTRALQGQLCRDDFLVPLEAVQPLAPWLNARFTFPGGGCWDGDRERWRVLSLVVETVPWRPCQ